MRRFIPAAFALGFWLGTSGATEAQYPVTPGLTIGTPPGYSYGYPNYSSYGSGRSYQPPAIRFRPVNPYGHVNRPYYGAYGYGNYSNGSTDGFPPFRGRRARR